MSSWKEHDGMMSGGHTGSVSWMNTMQIDLHRNQHLPGHQQDQRDLFPQVCQHHPIINIKKCYTFNGKLAITTLKCSFPAFVFRSPVFEFGYLSLRLEGLIHRPAVLYTTRFTCVCRSKTQEVDFQQVTPWTPIFNMVSDLQFSHVERSTFEIGQTEAREKCQSFGEMWPKMKVLRERRLR